MAKVAFLLADNFEDSEFRLPYDRLRQAGHEITVIGTEAGKEVKGKQGEETFTPEVTPDQVSPADFDALVIPGGYAPDKLRMDGGVVKFVNDIANSDKPVAAICHAGWLLAEAEVVDGRKVTSYSSIRTDLVNAGAEWVDEEVVVDGNLITSRGPDDLDAFCSAILDAI
jgi:protease I